MDCTFKRYNSFYKTHFVLISAMFIAVFELLLGIQGIDLRDSGFVLAAIQQIFDTPESNQYYFLYYFNAVIGGIWNFAFGWGGYMSFKILNLIVILTTYYFVQRLFKILNANKLWVFLGFMAVVLQQNREYAGLFVFHHNFTSALFATAAACVIMEGLTQNNNKKIYLSGLILGIGTFLRLPNAVVSIMAAAVIITDYAYNKDFKLLTKRGIICLSGFITGILAVLAFMALCKNHLEIFQKALFGDMTAVASNPKSSHNPNNLGIMYANNLKEVAIVATTTFLAFLIYKKFVIKNYILFLISLPLLIGLIYPFYKICYPTSIIYGYCYAIIIYSIVKNNKNRNLSLTCVVALAISVLQPIGSDFGLGNMGCFSIQILLPLAFYTIKDVNTEKINDTTIKKRWQVTCLAIFTLFVAIQIHTIIKFGSFGYPDNRFKMFSMVKNNRAANCLVSKQKAIQLDSLFAETQKYIKPGDYILCYRFLSGIYFLTKTKPYGYNSIEVGNIYRAQKENLPNPVIIREIVHPYGIIDNFIKEKNYKIVYQKYGYEILIPEYK